MTGSAPTGVLFDVDGTLVDTTYIHTVAWWQAFRRAEHDVPMALVHRAVGMGPDTLVPHVLGDGHDDEVHQLADTHDAIYSTYWESLRPFAGARDLVRRCREAGMTTVLASSAGGRELDVLRDVLDADDWLDHATSSDDADASKPHADLVRAALDKAGLAAEDVVFVGDAVWDVEATTRAGVRCIGLECGGTSAAELREAGAAQTFRDPTDLLHRWAESLLGATPDTLDHRSAS